MAEKVDKKPQTAKIKCKGPNLTIPLPEFTLEDFKKHSHIGSPTSAKPQSARWKNCLCSPTTHVGSFRCKHHRKSDLPRKGSVGSNLSNYAELSASRLRVPLTAQLKLGDVENVGIFKPPCSSFSYN